LKCIKFQIVCIKSSHTSHFTNINKHFTAIRPEPYFETNLTRSEIMASRLGHLNMFFKNFDFWLKFSFHLEFGLRKSWFLNLDFKNFDSWIWFSSILNLVMKNFDSWLFSPLAKTKTLIKNRNLDSWIKTSFSNENFNQESRRNEVQNQKSSVTS